MHEKDIQLARLLIARQSELAASGDLLRAKLADVEGRLEQRRKAVAERDTYADILAKAANLLQRDDLTVEAEDHSAEEEELAQVQAELAELETHEAQFRELTDALREKAPQLFDAATGELSVSSSPVPPVASQPVAEAAVETAEADAASTEDIGAGTPAQSNGSSAHAEAPGPQAAAQAEDWDESVKVYVAGRQRELTPEDEEYLARASAVQTAVAETPPASAPDEPLTDDELERFLTRFNMDVIQRQVIQSLGPEACFVIDGASVMNNIPYYDHSIRGGPVRFIRDELLRDFGLLSRHLDRAVHVVLDHEHAPELPLSAKLSLQALSGDEQGNRSAQDRLLKEVLADAAQRTQVCLVTGELTLGGSLRSRRVQFLPVADFFRM
jgi:hypothetical protein